MGYPAITGTGRLITAPNIGTTRTGGDWCNVMILFTAHRKTEAGVWEETGAVTVAAVAFNDTAHHLAAHAKGDRVTITGKVKELTVWNGRPQLSIAIDTVTTAVAYAQPAGVTTA